MLAQLLAHQGGWDEMLLAAGLVLGMLAISRFRRRTSSRTPRPLPVDACEYCGAALEPDEVRCPACGFRKPETAG
ncbi:MAG: hypothetical protein WEB90_04280 [Gemmatimonadota bacterium]